LESSWDRVLAKVQRKGGRDIGKHEGDVVGEWFGEDVGQSRQHVINADGTARDGAIDEDENDSDGVGVLPYQIRDTLLVELVMLNTASIGQPRCIEDANLGEVLHTHHVHEHQHLPLLRSCL